MDPRLAEVSINGDVEAFRRLTEQHPLLIDTTTTLTAHDTPLHIAALLGHTELAAEILKLRPALARARDGQGSQPLHLASARGHFNVVKKVLEIDGSLRLGRDKDGLTPLHLAAANNHFGLLKELLPVGESFGRLVTERRETVLHLSVKYNQFEAAKFIVETDKEIINLMDDRGNTALHLTTTKKNIPMLKLLLQETNTEVNAVNENSCTPLDILLQCPTSDMVDMGVCEILLRFGARKGHKSCPPSRLPTPPPPPQLPPEPPQISVAQKTRWTMQNLMPIGWNKVYREDETWVKDIQNTIMVVATLIAGATFQVGLNPPGGIWTEGRDTQKRDAGYFFAFVIWDTIALGSSLAIILFLISGLPLKNRLMTWILMIALWVAVSSMAVAYLMGANLLSQRKNVLTLFGLILFCWIILVGLILLYYFAVMLMQCTRWWINSCSACLGGGGHIV